MTRDDERLARANEAPIVGGLPDAPGIRVAMLLTPGLGVHLRGLADELLVHDYPGATIDRVDRELIATAVSAANDCFFCMDSHGAHASAVMQATGRLEAMPAIDILKNGADDGLDAKLAALVRIARIVRQAPRELTVAGRGGGEGGRRERRRRPAGGPDRGRLLDVQPHGGRVPCRHRAEHRGLCRAGGRDRRARLQLIAVRSQGGRAAGMTRGRAVVAVLAVVAVVAGGPARRRSGPPRNPAPGPRWDQSSAACSSGPWRLSQRRQAA